MESSTFPWLIDLTDEQAYEFLGEVIHAAHTAGTRTGFLQALDERAAAWATFSMAVPLEGVSE
ncbi:hypothetical protein [Streptomyces sp. NPDC059651]|uniref:hypothetical protein n=1 Tax=Streptomyces sp. NPDC059651 TaxID=3346897 RepID=UPI0036C8C0B7